MPLRDHFHPPLSLRRQWTAFHGAWATYLSAQLNKLLPAGFFAEPLCTFVKEIDIATFDEDGVEGGSVGGWTPPPPTLTVMAPPATDTVEVRIFRQEGGPELVACVELISPSNKDRPGEREMFVAKCAAYLNEGIGLVLVDIVTTRLSNLHTALLERVTGEAVASRKAELYTVAYRPVPAEQKTEIRIWEETLAVGQPLPKMPLWLKTGQCFPLDLEAAYELTCRELRLVLANGASA